MILARFFRWIAAFAVLLPAVAGEIPSVTVTGPIAATTALRDTAHGYPSNATPLDLAKQGYVQRRGGRGPWQASIQRTPRMWRRSKRSRKRTPARDTL